MKIVQKPWRVFIIASFIWLFIGDLIRKLIPGQPSEVILIVDLLILIAYLLFTGDVIKKRKLLWRPPFLIPTALFAAVFLVGALMHFEIGWKVVAVGFRSYLWFIPLMLLGFEMLETKESLIRFCKILCILAVPLLLLSAFQLIVSGSNQALLKPFEGINEFRNASFETIKLTTSVFGNAQRYGMMGMLLLLLSLGTGNFLAIPAFIGILFSGSGSAFVLSVAGFILFAAYNGKRIRKKTMIKIALSAAVVIAIITTITPFAITARSQLERIPMIFTSRVNIFAGEMETLWSTNFSFLGNGPGVVSQGVDYVSKRIVETPPTMGETGIRNLVLEAGLVGLIAFYTLWGSILWAMAAEIKKIKDLTLTRIGLAIFLFTSLILIRFTFMHGQTLNDYVVLVPLWFFVGVFFRLGSYGQKDESIAHHSNISPRLQ